MSIFLKLAWFFRLEKRRYLTAFVALMTIAGLIMVPPWITGRVVDAINQRQLTWLLLLEYTGLLFAIGLVIYLLRIVWRQQLFGASYKLAALLRSRIHDHLTLMPPTFFQQHHTGDLLARATNDVTAVEMTAGEAVLALVDGVVTGIIVLLVMMIMVSWKLTLLALLPWPLMGYLMWRFGNEMHQAFSEAQRQFSRLNDKTQETVSGVRLIKAFGQQQQTVAAFDVITHEVAAANLQVARVEAKYDPVIFATVACSYLLAIGGGAWWIHHGEMSLGELTSFTMYLGYLIWPMFAYGWTLNLMERGRAAHARIDALLNTPSEIVDEGSAAAPASHDLSIQIASFHYPGITTPALHQLDCVVATGATLGIVGPTGAGKTSLISLLLRQYQTQHGELKLADKPLADYSLLVLRQQFGVVPQDPFLFSMSIADNIALGLPEASLEQIRAAARLACVDDDIMAFPQQYQTLVGERGITLSGGQKQRIAIARALLLDPPILVLDDALSAVDVRTERTILQHLREARQGRSNLIVCHRLSAISEANEIIVLQHGTVSERGDHATLLAHDGWYAQMYRYQQIEQAIEG